MPSNAKRQLAAAKKKVAPKAKPKVAKARLYTVEERLNAVIVETLGGPRGDPERCNLEAAAHAFHALKALGAEVEDEQDTEETLRTGNLYDEDFLELTEVKPV